MDKNLKQICNYSDLQELPYDINLPIFNLENLRLKIINTKKWGEKIIYNEGAKSLCFSCYYLKNKKNIYIIFFNTNGTKEVESIYIHGIWRCNTSCAKSLTLSKNNNHEVGRLRRAGTITKVEMRGKQATDAFGFDDFINGKAQIQLETGVEFWVNTNNTDFTKYLIRSRIK